MQTFRNLLALACAVALLGLVVPISAQDQSYDSTHHFDIAPTPIQPVVTNTTWGGGSIGGCQPIEPRSTEAALARTAGSDSGAPLRFHVVDEVGNPIEGAEILVAQRRRPWRCLAFSTDQEGILSLDLRRPKRRHDLLINAPGFRTRVMTWSPPFEQNEQHKIALAAINPTGGT